MTNATALVFALVLVGAALVDVVLNGAGVTLFLGRQLIRITEYLAFWR